MDDRTWHVAQDQWREKYMHARAFMRQRAGQPGTLIEIAAQHPLADGLYPNDEFRARLDRGREVFDHYRAAGDWAEVYVPGSRHVFQGHPDRISLSEAGRAYLIDAGVPEAAIHGDDLNTRYRGDDGVYGSADECFVAASYYKDAGFGTLASVVSPAQMLRKTLHYIEFGVVPLNITAPTREAFHDYLDELFEKIPRVLTVDARLHPGSPDARSLRDERMPRDRQ